MCKARAMKLASIAEPQPILCKHFANERKESLLSICRVQLSIMQRYIFYPTPPSISQFFKFHAPTNIYYPHTDDQFCLPQIAQMDTDFSPDHWVHSSAEYKRIYLSTRMDTDKHGSSIQTIGYHRAFKRRTNRSSPL